LVPESAANDAQLARTSRFSADVLLAGSWYKLRLAIDPSALRMVLGALAGGFSLARGLGSAE
jgi:hypothetical protein